MGDPMLAEDLAQQAREAVIRRLREYPNCPYSHLINKARDAIFRYRQKGKSVDGLLYQQRRILRYRLTSLEEPLSREDESSGERVPLCEVLSDSTQPRRFTEERAINKVMFDTVRSYLCPKGNSALTLRLMGFSWREIRRDLNLGYREMESIKRDLVHLFQMTWHEPIKF